MSKSLAIWEKQKIIIPVYNGETSNNDRAIICS